MFWFCVLLSFITYPVVLLGSFLCGLIIFTLSDGYPSNTPNPFISPAKLYQIYRNNFSKWYTGVVNWYEEESNK